MAAGDSKGAAKKETVAALVCRQQGRQQKALADVYECHLKLDALVAKQKQEIGENSAELQLLVQDAAALTEIHRPLKARQGQLLQYCSRFAKVMLGLLRLYCQP